jgi:checkpoint serine/threonine-protein kinase
MLVDFGRAVDLTHIAGEYEDVRKLMLQGDASRKGMRCVAMRRGEPWSFDIDTYGILASVHVLLFGTHLELRQCGHNQWRPVNSMKRYWQKNLWDEIFTSLLNLDEDSGTALGSRARSLHALREKIDDYLKKEMPKLRSALRRQAKLLPASTEKL